MLAIFDSPESWLYVLAIAAVIFGSRKIPEIARSLGQARNEFRKGMSQTDDEPEPAQRPLPEPPPRSDA
jgi:TatA/E family protein of Tat protein translocase